MKYLASLVIIFSFFSCAEKEVIDLEKSFFDISVFIDSILVIEQIEDEVLRKIAIDSETEEKVLTEVDMTEILGYLKQFNINRPRWYDKYSVERSANSTIYTALDEDLDVKELVVNKINNEINEIDILYKSKTLISSSEKKVKWIPSKTLTINNKSNSLWSAEQNMLISWTYTD